jgi:NTE family protein
MTKALVLSGGGAVGIAWEIGLAAGLARAGIDVRDADFITGTSSASIPALQLALRRDPGEMAGEQLTAAGPYLQTAIAPESELIHHQAVDRFAMMARAISGEGTPEARRAEIGRQALAAAAVRPEEQIVGALWSFGSVPWPERFACPAVNAVTGEFAVWDAQAGVGLDRAVASSYAVPIEFAPITINGQRYMDAGSRSGTNADLASGHDQVLIISVLRAMAGIGSDQPLLPFARQLEAEVSALKQNGSAVEVIEPDAEGAEVLGQNLMDPTFINFAVPLALKQGESEAARLRRFWSDR